MKGSVLCRGVLILVFLWNGMPGYVNSAGCARGGTTFIRTSSVTVGASVYTGSDDYLALAQTDHTQCYSLCYRNDDCKAYFLDHINQTCILTKEEHSVIRPQLKRYQAGSYHRKICLSGVKCKRHWAFDVVPGIRFVKQEDKVVPDIGSEDRCIEACSIEKSFVCRSAIYELATRNCVLSMHDRRSAPEAFKMSFKDVDYLENQCISEPSQCIFHEQSSRILVHLHVYLSISSTTRERCRKACVEHSDFRCRSFMFDDARALCLLTPEDSYSSPESVVNIDKQGGTRYELGSCIEVKMQCDSTSMTAVLRVSKPFRGTVYALGHPKECYAVTAGDKGEIAITLPLHGRKCGTKNLGNGTFTNDVVVQHNPFVLRNTDRRIEIACDYDEVRQRIRSGKEVEEGVSQSLPQVITGLAPTPTVKLLVVKKTGEGINGVELGDPLLLKVAMLDESVYGIFGSSLVALSGEGSDTILLIDDRGCPVEPNVFPSLIPTPGSKSLQAPFQAFKFASDSTVRFRMTVSFCLDVCPPVDCNSNYTQSFQRHRRSTANTSFLEIQAGDFINDVIMESTLFTVESSKSAPPVEPRAGKLNVESHPFIDSSKKGLCLTFPVVIKVAVIIGVIQVALISFCALFLIFTRKSRGYSGKPRQTTSRTSISSNAKLFPDIS
ncbi:uncharacterized protein LOC106460835 [Limulus polyphemus]|uniref:Uncharacterized protein LOC106460835 n=1 Tax=Limulus polyphemus TaxID=6850 RepID=A0ABM1SI89_LIMPO|nr:uncharacterized protein LOC106460835 [Limulus polyphemus]